MSVKIRPVFKKEFQLLKGHQFITGAVLSNTSNSKEANDNLSMVFFHRWHVSLQTSEKGGH